MNDWSQLSDDLSRWGWELTEEQKEKLGQYYALLTEWNAQMNLTAIESFPDFCRLHVADSLALLRFLPADFLQKTSRRKMADIGSGAGFPGMILKLFAPEWEVCLIESQAKRVRFLEEVRRTLFLSEPEDGIQILQMRAEEAGRMTDMRATCSLVTARAVAQLSTLLEYALPLLETGGLFAAYKSRDTDGEIRAAAKATDLLGGRILRTEDYVLPNTDTARRLILVKKVRPTDLKYPRRPGMAKKDPI